jgi:hypothetical protein
MTKGPTQKCQIIKKINYQRPINTKQRMEQKACQRQVFPKAKKTKPSNQQYQN